MRAEGVVMSPGLSDAKALVSRAPQQRALGEHGAVLGSECVHSITSAACACCTHRLLRFSSRSSFAGRVCKAHKSRAAGGQLDEAQSAPGCMRAARGDDGAE